MCTFSMSYIRVITSGTVLFCILTIIYCYICNADLLRVSPTKLVNSSEQISVLDGISCAPTNDKNDYSSCNTMTQQMVALSEQNPDWKCSAYTHQSHIAFLNLSHWIEAPLYTLITTLFLFCTYSIIHDISLLRHKHNLNSFLLYPRTTKEFFAWKLFVSFCTNYTNRCCRIIFIVPIAIIAVLLLCVDTLFMMFIYPLLGCCKANLLHRLSYQSAAMMAISNLISTVLVGVICIRLTTPQTSITALDNSLSVECECYCNYVMVQKAYYAMIGITFVLMVFNVKFMYLWMMGAAYGQHFPYLIRYALPMRVAVSMNNADPFGIMLVDNRAAYKQLIGNEETEESVSRTERSHVPVMRYTTFYYRRGIMMVSICCACIFLVSLGLFLMRNPYNYPLWVQHVMPVILLIATLIVLTFVQCRIFMTKYSGVYVYDGA